jgi:hypothetical protein
VTKWLIAALAFLLLVGGATGSYFVFLRGPSKPEYVEKADPICKTSNGKLGTVAAPTDLTQLRDASAKLAADSTDTAKSLKRLELPRGDDAKVASEITKLIQDSGTKAQALSDAAGKEDLAGAEKAAAEINAAFKSADEKARAFGMAECGKAGATAAQTISMASSNVLKQTVITRADALCAKVNDEVEKLPEANTAKQGLEGLDKLISLHDKLIADLKALPVSGADKPAFDEVVSDIQKIRDQHAHLKDAALSGSEKKMEDVFTEWTKVSDAGAVRAENFGFKDCRKTIEA